MVGRWTVYHSFTHNQLYRLRTTVLIQKQAVLYQNRCFGENGEIMDVKGLLCTELSKRYGNNTRQLDFSTDTGYCQTRRLACRLSKLCASGSSACSDHIEDRRLFHHMDGHDRPSDHPHYHP